MTRFVGGVVFFWGGFGTVFGGFLVGFFGGSFFFGGLGLGWVVFGGGGGGTKTREGNWGGSKNGTAPESHGIVGMEGSQASIKGPWALFRESALPNQKGPQETPLEVTPPSASLQTKNHQKRK